jgi:hypothetical protein
LAALVAILTVALGVRPAARAADDLATAKEADDPRHSAVYAILGLATPVGFLGLEGVHRFGSYLELSVGLGEGTSVFAGVKDPVKTLQGAVMPRLRLGGARRALTLGAGLSGGGFGWPRGDCYSNCTLRVDYAFWANVEIGVELFFHRLAFRGFLGAGVLNPTIDSSSAHVIAGLPYAGVGVGAPF